MGDRMSIHRNQCFGLSSETWLTLYFVNRILSIYNYLFGNDLYTITIEMKCELDNFI